VASSVVESKARVVTVICSPPSGMGRKRDRRATALSAVLPQ
jgi:hypothetical protein